MAAYLSIKIYPNEVVAGNEFSVEAELSEISSGIDYFVKSVGGENDQKVRTYSELVGSWLAFNGAWANMPKFNISTGSSVMISIKSKFYDEVSGSQNYFLKVQNPSINSSTVQINVIQPTPTATLSPTSEPTLTPRPPSSTPLPSKTSTPSKTPTLTKTPTPTKKPEKTKSSTGKVNILKKLTPTMNQNDDKILGVTTEKMPFFGSEIVQVLVLTGLLFGALSIATYVYQANETKLKEFYRRKFQKE